MNPLRITNYTVSTALGLGRESNIEKLLEGETGLVPCDFKGAEMLDTWIGKVMGLEDVSLPSALESYDCRNNRLALAGLQQDGMLDAASACIEKYGAERVAVILGTSTSGILQTELAYQTREAKQPLPGWYDYQCTHNAHSISDFVSKVIGSRGITYTISTACSSSAKVFASARRLIESGICDAALVGGVDTLCLTTLFGFNSLQLVSSQKCKPCDANRDGISIGESAGFALVEKYTQAGGEPAGDLLVKGYGESSDAYHMSSPHPEGKGAYLAMDEAVAKAGLKASDIDYINLHGTGTKVNDLSETKAIARLFGSGVPCSSTKGWTGHTLGACGITEISFSLMAIEKNFLPVNLNLEKLDNEIETRIVDGATINPPEIPVKNVASNSFGFGGTNCCIVVGRA